LCFPPLCSHNFPSTLGFLAINFQQIQQASSMRKGLSRPWRYAPGSSLFRNDQSDHPRSKALGLNLTSQNTSPSYSYINIYYVYIYILWIIYVICMYIHYIHMHIYIYIFTIVAFKQT
jgi:hypothetical protein